MSYRFSIIIPVYNVEPYLRECLDSVLDQCFVDYEVCLVDDGSQDNSGTICDEYALKYNRFKVLHQDNGGVSLARNAALCMASGEFVWFVDADDYVERNCLQYLDDIIQRSQCDTVFFGDNRFQSSPILDYDTCEKHQFLSHHISYCNPLMLFNRSIIEDNRIRFTPTMKMAEDLEFQYKYLLHSKNPVSIPYNLYYIRKRDGSASRSSVSLQNNFDGDKHILSSILEYTHLMEDKGCDWLGIRMAERVKDLIQTAKHIPIRDYRAFNKLVRYYINSYRSLGFDGFNDRSLALASIDVRIYYWIYQLFYRIKRIQI